MESRIERYAKLYAKDDGFEAVVVRFRQRVVLERLRAHLPRLIVEVGCGSDLLARRAIAEGLPFDRWVIVEPAETFGAIADQLAAEEPRVTRVAGYFGEALRAEVRAAVGASPDAVVISGLLHEIPDAVGMLRAARDLVSAEGFVHINVPNATSLHRRIAVAMGLIYDLKAPSHRNVALEQARVYDIDSLGDDVRAAGLKIELTGGFLVKPFTHSQMQAIRHVVDEKLLEGLFELGRKDPNLACEIFADARH